MLSCKKISLLRLSLLGKGGFVLLLFERTFFTPQWTFTVLSWKKNQLNASCAAVSPAELMNSSWNKLSVQGSCAAASPGQRTPTSKQIIIVERNTCCREHLGRHAVPDRKLFQEAGMVRDTCCREHIGRHAAVRPFRQDSGHQQANRL